MDTSYRVKLHPGARSDLAGLDKGLQRQASKQLRKLKRHPHAGEPLGHKAGYNLTGYRSLHFAGERYRVVYKVDEESELVTIIAIAKQAKFKVYRLAVWRANE